MIIHIFSEYKHILIHSGNRYAIIPFRHSRKSEPILIMESIPQGKHKNIIGVFKNNHGWKYVPYNSSKFTRKKKHLVRKQK